MGNRSSCSASSTAHPHSTLPPSLIAKVLLIDGSMLHFTHPVKVIRLLLDYPHHFVCPLNSLRPGHHSLSSLLPDEELQLGHLYLLLPFQTFQSNRGAPSGNRVPAATPASADISKRFPAKVSSAGEQSRLQSRLQRHSSDLGHSSSEKDVLSDGSFPSSRLCDTPELQRAYRSVMLRRCRTWTPRLQAIKEGKKGVNKNS